VWRSAPSPGDRVPASRRGSRRGRCHTRLRSGPTTRGSDLAQPAAKAKLTADPR
jgi:hypothetical protein